MSYKKKQEKWIKKHDVKVGDFVKVVKKYNSGSCFWVPNYMNSSIGKIFKVIGFSGDGFNSIKLENECCYSRKSLKKITDLKELVPFYVECGNLKEKEKTIDILKNHYIFRSGHLSNNEHLKISVFSREEKEIKFTDFPVSHKHYSQEKDRKLTYEQLQRFEKIQVTATEALIKSGSLVEGKQCTLTELKEIIPEVSEINIDYSFPGLEATIKNLSWKVLEVDDYKDIKNQLKKAKEIILELEEKINNLENK